MPLKTGCFGEFFPLQLLDFTENIIHIFDFSYQDIFSRYFCGSSKICQYTIADSLFAVPHFLHKTMINTPYSIAAAS